MGAKISKPPPHRIEPEETGVEVFQEATPEAPRDSNSTKRQKGDTTAQGSTHVVRSILHEQPPLTNGSEIDNKPTETQTKEKKRRRSKKDKNKLPPPKLVRAQTQLNELKNVKPMLQSPQARQQHYEQIKDAYALDEEAKKAPPSDAKARFFSFENWRKMPQTPSDKDGSPTTHSPPPLTRSQSSRAPRALFASGGRNTEEIEDLEDSRDLSDIESLPLPPATRTSAITAPTITTTPNFLVVSNQAERVRPDVQTTPVIRVRTSERRTPERSKRSLRSQRSDLRLDDVDEDLMDHILTDDSR